MSDHHKETTPPSSRKKNLKVLFGIGTGNAMEWFDWNIYALFAVFFAPQFFSSGSPMSDLLKTFGVFAVGFVARPFGGVLFGLIADRRGRQFSMTVAVGLAAVGSLIIGLTPTHETIGAWAAVVLVTCRMIQGLAHGGELPSANTYISEMAPREKRGLWASLIYFSGTIGIICGAVLAAVLSGILTDAQMSSYGWRIPFVLGGVFGLFALYLRSRLQETEIFESSAKSQKSESQQAKPSLWSQIREHRRLLVRVAAMTVGSTVNYYVWAVATPAYAISVHGVDPSGAMWAGAAANVVFIIMLPVWGTVSDRIGRRPVLIFSGIMMITLLFPLTSIIRGQAWQLFVAMAIALVFMAGTVSIGPAVFSEMFPTRMRAGGIGLPTSLAVAIFGGTTPYLQAFFADKGIPGVFNWYAIVLMAISVATVIFFLPESKGKDLTAAGEVSESLSPSSV
ncbi:MFS transporter [Rhodococcus sp. 66b]|uniref:MFS transporter n=1 Tax=Rhodococcus sp. 66b TaxID=1945511 RepID=UPI0009BBE8B6|nr:MFS transporter [Rhodococcus sp. 66b]OQM79920.1 Alpha-ketoglutarate permease [Rhodococcus sp. 66b]